MKQLIQLIKEETEFLKTLQEVTQEDLQCSADDKRDELREDGIDTNTEYGLVKDEDNKGSAIL